MKLAITESPRSLIGYPRAPGDSWIKAFLDLHDDLSEVCWHLKSRSQSTADDPDPPPAFGVFLAKELSK